MKTIKKVSVTPLQQNEGKIIDSLNSADDKTINAPSIRAVNTALNNKVNNSDLTNYKLKGDYAVVTGNLTLESGAASGAVAYPSGFTKTNCVVLSFMANNTANTNWGYGYLESSNGYVGGAIGHKVSLTDSEITININNPQSHDGGTLSYNYKIVLMKVS